MFDSNKPIWKSGPSLSKGVSNAICWFQPFHMSRSGLPTSIPFPMFLEAIGLPLLKLHPTLRSMYGIFTYMWFNFMVNVSKYTHGSYGYVTFRDSIHPKKQPRTPPPLPCSTASLWQHLVVSTRPEAGETPKPIGSMGLVYLPTWLVDLNLFGKLAGKYTSLLDPSWEGGTLESSDFRYHSLQS